METQFFVMVGNLPVAHAPSQDVMHDLFVGLGAEFRGLNVSGLSQTNRSGCAKLLSELQAVQDGKHGEQLRAAADAARRMMRQIEAMDPPAASPVTEPQAARGQRHRDVRHSPDFSEVNWYGERYLFTKTQARAMAILWRGWETGGATVAGQSIVKELDLGASRTLAGVFRGNKAWKTLIIPSPVKGAYRLNDPADPVLQVARENKPTGRRKGKHTGTRIGKRTGTRK